MLKLNTENKEMLINFEGRNLNKRQIEQVRENLLEDIGSEKDADKLSEMTIKLAQINSAITALSQVDEAKRQVQHKQQQNTLSERELARQAADIFRSNCMLITPLALSRFLNLSIPHPLSDEEHLFDRKAAQYYRQLFESLSYDHAQKQADEIFAAARENREWREIVALPKPVVENKAEVKTWNY